MNSIKSFLNRLQDHSWQKKPPPQRSLTEGGGGGHGGHPHLPQRDRAPPRRTRGLRRGSPGVLLHRHVLAQEGFKAEF